MFLYTVLSRGIDTKINNTFLQQETISILRPATDLLIDHYWWLRDPRWQLRRRPFFCFKIGEANNKHAKTSHPLDYLLPLLSVSMERLPIALERLVTSLPRFVTSLIRKLIFLFQLYGGWQSVLPQLSERKCGPE